MSIEQGIAIFITSVALVVIGFRLGQEHERDKVRRRVEDDFWPKNH